MPQATEKVAIAHGVRKLVEASSPLGKLELAQSGRSRHGNLVDDNSQQRSECEALIA
jgi:hypothetical protein